MSAAALWWRPILVALAVTLLVTLLSHSAPLSFAATLVGGVFFAATYVLVLRHDADTIHRHGLSLGGLFEPEPLDAKKLLRSAGEAASWCVLFAVLFFPPFFLGYQIWFAPESGLRFAPGTDPLDEVLGQVFAVALPEEMFYRGYLQSELDRAFPPRFRVLGATLGWGLLISSAIFALGHLLTSPNPARLAVFFPSLLFGWLRARTGGIGAAVLFHAACNLFSAYLARGYGFAV